MLKPWLMSVCALLVCGLAVAGPVAAQETTQATAEAASDLFVDVIDVNLVNLEVYVTDDDEPVSGLTIDDFEVLEDGEPVELTNFYAVEAGRPVLMGDEPEAAPVRELQPEVKQVDPEQQLSLIVYVDDFNLLPRHRNKAFEELHDFLLQRLDAGDKAMLVSYDLDIEVHTPLTNDPDVLFTALESLQRRSSRRDVLQREYTRLIRQIVNADEALDFAIEACSLSGGVRALAQQMYQETQLSMQAMSRFVTGLEGIPGRKALLHLSSGLQQRPAEELYYAWWNQFSANANDCSMSQPQFEAQAFDLQRFYRELAAHANAHRVTFYTLNAGGYERFGSIGADTTRGDVLRTQPVWSSFEEAIRRENNNSGLRTLAIETGGQPLLNLNRFTNAIQQVASDFDSYYSLGYLAGEGDEADRKIEVRLKAGPGGERRRGVEVRHRTGYRKKSRSELAAAHTLSALYMGQESNPMGIRVEVGQGTRQDDDVYRVPVLVRIPIAQLALIPHEGTHQARLKVFLVVGEQVGGRLSTVHEMDVPVSIPPEQVRVAATQDFGFTAQLDVRSGEQRLAVGVLDAIAATASYVNISFDASAGANATADASDANAGAGANAGANTGVP